MTGHKICAIIYTTMLYYLVSICLSYLFAIYVAHYIRKNCITEMYFYIYGLMDAYYVFMIMHIILLFTIFIFMGGMSICTKPSDICGIFRFVYFCGYIFIVIYSDYMYAIMYSKFDIEHSRLITTKLVSQTHIILSTIIFVVIYQGYLGEYIVVLLHVPFFVHNLFFYSFIKKHKDDVIESGDVDENGMIIRYTLI